MESVELSDKKQDKVSVQDVIGDDSSLLWKQTRTRRLFSTAQLFAFTLVYFGTWYFVGADIYLSLFNGGTAGWFFSYFLICFGVFFQVASFAELASILPVAGAQYYWTYQYAPPKAKLFLTWIQGWTTWLGYVSMMASSLQGLAIILEGLISLNHETYVEGSWRTTLLVIGWVTFMFLVSSYCFRAVPWFELAAGILNVVLFLVVLVMLWVMAPRNDMSVFLIQSSASGWDNYPVAFNVGSLANIFLFLGFEGMIHMGEETRNPKKAVPKAMFWGTITNMLLGLVMIFTYGLTMPPIQDLLDSVSPVVTMLLYGTGSTQATTAIISCFLFLNIAGNIGVISSVSRLTWAWARDGGLPTYLSIVDGRTRVPVRAVFVSALIVALLSLLNLNSGAYIALSAITSIATFSLYLSYAIILFCIIYTRIYTPGGLQVGEWHFGPVLGMIFNVIALIYTVFEMIWMPFPTVLPVTAADMNYSGPIVLGVLIGAVTYWFLWARKNWPGPNLKIIEIVLRDEASHEQQRATAATK